MTKVEMAEELLSHWRTLAEYWSKTEIRDPYSRERCSEVGEVRYRLEGLLHSILADIDGCSISPRLLLTPVEGDPDWPEVPINDNIDLRYSAEKSLKSRGMYPREE